MQRRMVVYTPERNEKIISNLLYFEAIFCDYKSEFTRSDKYNNNNNNNNNNNKLKTKKIKHAH